MDDLVAFARLLDALRPWLGDLVIVGGWAHRLYRFDNLARLPGYRPVTTKDADLAFATEAPLVGDIGAALEAAGFNQVFSGDHIPPATEYRLGTEEQEFFAEFLTPLLGDASQTSARRTFCTSTTRWSCSAASFRLSATCGATN